MLAQAPGLKNPGFPVSMFFIFIQIPFCQLTQATICRQKERMQSRQESGCSTKNLSFILLESTCPLGQTHPAIGPHFDHFAQLCPFGPSFGLLGSPVLHLRASSAAPFCLSGHPRASLGILGPGHILQGNFPFYCDQLSTFQKENLAPGKGICPEITLLFNYQPCRGISESEF